MFKTRKAQVALLVDLHEELVRKMDELIKAEARFIGVIENFFMFEKKMEQERWRAEQLDEARKKASANDMRF